MFLLPGPIRHKEDITALTLLLYSFMAWPTGPATKTIGFSERVTNVKAKFLIMKRCKLWTVPQKIVAKCKIAPKCKILYTEERHFLPSGPLALSINIFNYWSPFTVQTIWIILQFEICNILMKKASLSQKDILWNYPKFGFQSHPNASKAGIAALWGMSLQGAQTTDVGSVPACQLSGCRSHQIAIHFLSSGSLDPWTLIQECFPAPKLTTTERCPEQKRFLVCRAKNLFLKMWNFWS